MELTWSDAQFERLVGMLADNRVEMREAFAEIKQELSGVKKDIAILHAAIDPIHEDLTEIQKALRSQSVALGRQDQALDGLTQLGKTNFDLTESLNKHIHGEAEGSGEEEASQGAPYR